jgi:hypothetical protein
MIRHLTTGLLIATCGAQKSSLPPDQVVAFGARDRDAATSIVIQRDGQVVGVIHWPDEPQQERRGVLSPSELAALEKELRAHDCCALDSKRVYPYADEPRVTLSIKWNELDCAVELWADEWTERADAKACNDAMLRATGASARAR